MKDSTGRKATTQTLLTRRELAQRLGKNPRTIAKWLEEGLPVASVGRGGRPSKYDESAVQAWLNAREESARASGPDFMQSRARKELAQAIEAEQRVAIRAGKLMPIEEVDRLWSGQVAAVRARLLSWPTALADRLHRVATLEGVAAVEALLQEAVHDALREFAHVPEVKARPSRKRRRKTAKKRTAKRARS